MQKVRAWWNERQENLYTRGDNIMNLVFGVFPVALAIILFIVSLAGVVAWPWWYATVPLVLLNVLLVRTLLRLRK